MNHKYFSAAPFGQRQRGVVLMLALIMLVAMTLAGIALYRQLGTGLIIARNLTFARTAAVAADLGVEAARTWIAAPQPAVTYLAAQATSGKFFYYPAWCYSSTVQSVSGVAINCGNTLTNADFDPTTYDWTHSVVASTNDGGGHEIRYVIHRLCALPGGIDIVDTPNQRCVSIGKAPAGQSQSVAGYGGTQLALVTMPYYRITVRVQDNLNTRVFTQAIVY